VLEDLDATPAWAFLAVLFGLVAILLLGSWLLPGLVYEGFVEPYLWRPIVNDEGFNPVNTASLLLIVLLILGWYYRQFGRLGQRFSMDVGWAALPVFVWGSLLRVLEDSDLFSPYREDLVASGLAQQTSCAPSLGGGFLSTCFGAMMITPIIWILLSIALYLLARLGGRSWRVSLAFGTTAGVRYFGLSLVALVLLLLAAHRQTPALVRFAPHPMAVITAALAAFAFFWLMLRREGAITWYWGMASYGLFGLIVTASYPAVWFLRASDAWKPTEPTHAWVLLALIAVPSIIVWALRSHATRLAAEPPARRNTPPTRATIILIYLVLVELGLMFASVAAAKILEQGFDAQALMLLAAGPLAVGGLVLFVRGPGAARIGGHPGFALLATPLNLAMLWAHLADGYSTSLALDLYGAGEKHVLPRALIGAVEAVGLDAYVGGFTATFVMLPYKLLVTLFAIWALDAKLAPHLKGRETLLGILKMGIVAIGLGPAVRNTLRLAMGV
jgi:uncharacterized membrane protein